MKDTATLKALRLHPDIDYQDFLTSFLDDSSIDESKFYEKKIRPEIQEKQEVEIRAFTREIPHPPEWLAFIRPYFMESTEFKNFKRFDLIVTVKTKTGNIFIFTGGTGYHAISKFLDPNFGIEILERVIDPDLNKIESINEKGIVGDVLASSRFYRKSRPIIFEDDFGKYFQKIVVKLRQDQLAANFPNLVKGPGGKPVVTISGSLSIELKTKDDFFTFLQFAKDIDNLLQQPPKPIFNRTLVPLSIRQDKSTIEELEKKLFLHLFEIAEKKVASNKDIDLDFCHRNFEEFFSSETISFQISKCNPPLIAESTDVYEAQNLALLQELHKNHVDEISDGSSWLKSVRIQTMLAARETTSGGILDYIQAEVKLQNVPYFLLDKKWYRLEQDFDKALSELFVRRYRDRFENPTQIKPWSQGHDEHKYNYSYKTDPNAVCIHPLKVGNVELFDVALIDDTKQMIDFLFVKDGLDAKIRDLSSQVFMGAKIIETDIYTGKLAKLKELYQIANKDGRFDHNGLKEAEFLRRLQTYKRRYFAVARPSTGTTLAKIKSGQFASRIAKFSLVELAAAMRIQDWSYFLAIV